MTLFHFNGRGSNLNLIIKGISAANVKVRKTGLKKDFLNFANPLVNYKT